MGATSNRKVGLEFRKIVVGEDVTFKALLAVSSSYNNGTTAAHEWVDLTDTYDTVDDLRAAAGKKWSALLSLIQELPSTEAGFAAAKAAVDALFGVGKADDIDALDDAQGVWQALEAYARAGCVL